MKKMIALLLFLTVAINTVGCGNFSEKEAENNYEEQVIVDEWVQKGCIGEYYGWESGTCQFDSQEFKDILTFCNQIMSNDNQLEGTRDESIKQGNILLVNESDFVPQDILTYTKLFGDEISYIRYPNKEGQENYFVFDNQIGICLGSDVKEGAWEFLSRLLSSEY